MIKQTTKLDMSRNLLSHNCYYDGHPIEITGEKHKITKNEANGYYDEFRGLLVAKAECPACKAKYLAWMYPPALNNRRTQEWGEDVNGKEFYDLSFRSTFNDEPGEKDKPEYEVKVERNVKYERIGEYNE